MKPTLSLSCSLSLSLLLSLSLSLILFFRPFFLSCCDSVGFSLGLSLRLKTKQSLPHHPRAHANVTHRRAVATTRPSRCTTLRRSPSHWTCTSSVACTTEEMTLRTSSRLLRVHPLLRVQRTRFATRQSHLRWPRSARRSATTCCTMETTLSCW